MAAIGGTGASSGRLVGCANFVRHNPKSDRFVMNDFDHLELWCADATSTARRFSAAFGLRAVAAHDLDNGSMTYTSFCLQSNNVRMAFTAPYWSEAPESKLTRVETFPGFDREECFAFVKRHGVAVRAVGIAVESAAQAYEQCLANGGKGVRAPVTLTDENGTMTYCEVTYVEDVVFRFVEGRAGYRGPFLPGYRAMGGAGSVTEGAYGLRRVDHVVTNAPSLLDVTQPTMNMTGFHEFGEFVAADVGTVDSGLNSMIMANNTLTVLLPVNEPTFGTRRKSQIQSYLEHHQSAGIQHIAISTPDVIATVRQMRAAEEFGGVQFMPAPGAAYYEEHVPQKMGNMVTPELIAECRELGILIDRDDEGGLLQIFTKPVLDRPTLFIEIIQRLGCEMPSGVQKPACGGFGKGNFGALFKSIEDWEKARDGEAV